jgi:dihydroorotate dehydrogenase (NAD+) catalytic subunit
VKLFGTDFANPVHLAAGTCGFGMEVAEVVELEALGGFVTKSVTREPRAGNPAPRVAEFGAGMINSIGLANPGVDEVLRSKIPWLAANVRRARVWISVAGHTVDEYADVVGRLAEAPGFLGFELNLSCPNVGGRPFALDPGALAEVVARCRVLTSRPLLAKLAPNDADLPATARAAEESGADGVTLVNTLPGRVLDPETGRPALGAVQGGVSGAGLRPVGVQAVAAVSEGVRIPVVGVGGILAPGDALQYLRAGASLVQMGTASFADPRAPERVARELGRRRHLPGPWSAGAASDAAPLPAGVARG